MINMDDIERVVSFFESIEKSDWNTLQEIIADDFKYFESTPDPIGKEIWLDFQIAIQTAFPDWAYNIQKVERINNAIEVTVSITGTHLGELNLPIEGFSSLPATRRKIHMPEEHALISLENGKIKELRIEQKLHGSLPGLLEQLGVE
ncbi:hypothetical protein wcw_0900 [Waddlia chondrophila WSU 86-1044]|uniref:Ester cyclase n=2 Tax=Waddlia chondrophila TaxID=71667 RepID=D6YVV1_WADCW|nr:hypothetical protein wcw_0900 [Waddlia chondrophila WSU 86-1044]